MGYNSLIATFPKPLDKPVKIVYIYTIQFSYKLNAECEEGRRAACPAYAIRG
jgi:hypothetical protein